MQNWSGDENAAMKGYIQYAVNLMNADSRDEYGVDLIDELKLETLFRYLRRATDDLTADEAYNYYQKH